MGDGSGAPDSFVEARGFTELANDEPFFADLVLKQGQFTEVVQKRVAMVDHGEVCVCATKTVGGRTWRGQKDSLCQCGGCVL